MFSTSVMRDLKKQYEAEGAKEYREANRRVQKAVKKAKEDWIGTQCEEIETCLHKNNSMRTYKLVKDLTSEKQGRSSTIQDKSGKCLTEEKETLSRWTEYCKIAKFIKDSLFLKNFTKVQIIIYFSHTLLIQANLRLPIGIRY